MRRTQEAYASIIGGVIKKAGDQSVENHTPKRRGSARGTEDERKADRLLSVSGLAVGAL